MEAVLIAKRYAKALVNLAAEKQLLEQVKEDVQVIKDIGKENRELVAIFNSPVIPAGKKLRVADSVFGAHVQELTIEFLKLVLKHNREFFFRELISEFELQYKKHVGIKTVYVTTAVALTAQSRADLLAKVKGLTASSVDLVENVDASTIGGMIIRMDDKQYNASVQAKLNQLKKSFSSNLYINNN